MEEFLSTETLVIELLLVVTVVAIAVRRFNIPYTVALVLMGLFLATQQSIDVNLTPELIMALFIPPLVFEAALHINLGELRRNLPGILTLAVPGVIISTLIVGGLVSVVTRLAFPVALVFGAIVSATDPVAVVAIFRTLGIPKRLAVIVESESLFNDGTAIVVFKIALAVALTGQFNLLFSAGEFIRVAVGGIVTGLFLGWIISRVIARIDDYLIETTLTTLLAFGAYLVAERLSFSGVLAVVAAGLINGNLGPRGMSPTSRIVITNFWEYVAFLANSLIFLLIGLEINVPALFSSWKEVLVAISGVLIARAVVVYGLGWVVQRFSYKVSVHWLHVLNWGGLRGAIALALALNLPAGLAEDAELIRLMAFGVVLFTLLVQGTTMGYLLKSLGLATRLPERVDYEKRHARLVAGRAALRHLDRRHAEGLISSHVWEMLRSQLSIQVEGYVKEVRDLLKLKPALEAEELDTAYRESLRAQRNALIGMQHDGVISADIIGELSAEIDDALGADRPLLPDD